MPRRHTRQQEFLIEFGNGMKSTCRQCVFFEDHPIALERALPGIRALGSAFSSTMGRAGICSATGRLMDPIDSDLCAYFQRRTPDEESEPG